MGLSRSAPTLSRIRSMPLARLHAPFRSSRWIFGTESNGGLHLGEEFPIRLSGSEARGIKDAIDMFRQTQLLHQVGGSQVFLIGCQIHTDSRGAKRRKLLQQRRDETRVPFEPIG